MKIELCEKRTAIVNAAGHLLVLGGPGSGKTTIALIKAQRRCETLRPGQEVLFLSFSRAAVRQILLRCREIFTAAERRLIQVQTYHSFCLDVLQSHGRLLGGRPLRFLFPGDERIRQSEFAGDWSVEQLRLAAEDGLFAFDRFANGVATLLEQCAALRKLYGEKHPLVIIDEFQDTNDDQWRIVRALSTTTDVFCLADPDQRIFDYLAQVDPRRLDMLRKDITPREFDLAGENHRSPTAGILSFASAVLRNNGPLPTTDDVKIIGYFPKLFGSTVHAAVVWAFSQLRRKGVERPCVAVLCRGNFTVAKLSGFLNEEHTYRNAILRPVEHNVVWDAELSAAAAAVVGSILEWPSRNAADALSRTLAAVAHFYRMKNAQTPSAAAADNARKYREAAEAVAADGPPKIKAAKAIVAAFEDLRFIGDPVEDWKSARRILQQIKPLAELFREVLLVRLFRATDALAAGLGDLWVETGAYAGAADLVKRVLDRDRLISADRDPEGCIVMTIHKSKGKEFDGVVMVEGAYESPFFDEKRERSPFEPSRRLLRVGITRARVLVTMVRPAGARPLVG